MFHIVPEEYTRDAHLMTLYQIGFNEGLYNKTILDERKPLDKETELPVYANDRRAGELKRKEASE